MKAIIFFLGFALLFFILVLSTSAIATAATHDPKYPATIEDTESIIVEEGKGFGKIIVGNLHSNKKLIKARLGRPANETAQWLNYRPQYGLDFLVTGRTGPVTEIRLNKGFKGRLTSNISLSSSRSDVFSTYGKPTGQAIVSDLGPHSQNRVLFKKGNHSKIFYDEKGLLFWFSGDQISQVVIFKKSSPPSPAMPPSAHIVAFKDEESIGAPTNSVEEMSGLEEIVVGDPRCTKQFIKSKLGPPESEGPYWLGYLEKYGVYFGMATDADLLIEETLTEGFKGRLVSNISLSSTMDDVFRTYGKPVAEEVVETFLLPNVEDRMLYEKGTKSQIDYASEGLRFKFDGNRLVQIVIIRRKGGGTSQQLLMASAQPQTFEISPDASHPRWGPLVRIERLWDYMRVLWIYWYITLAVLVSLAFLSKDAILKLYYAWRPLPEGRLLLMSGPADDRTSNINIWYQVRRLRKRYLLVGSGDEADIEIPDESVERLHAQIYAQRSEGGVTTYIKGLGDALVTVNGSLKPVMPLTKNAEVCIGRFVFRYEQPTEYRQVQVRFRNGKMVEGVPTSWDINGSGFTLIPSKAPTWLDAKFINFRKLKGVYFVRDWDEDVRANLLKGGRRLREHPTSVHFYDGEIVRGHVIGEYQEQSGRFYFFPEDQSGDTVYILVERRSTKLVEQSGVFS